MANGVTRLALSKMKLKNSPVNQEMNEEMAILQKEKSEKMPLKAAASKHNHSK